MWDSRPLLSQTGKLTQIILSRIRRALRVVPKTSSQGGAAHQLPGKPAMVQLDRVSGDSLGGRRKIIPTRSASEGPVCPRLRVLMLRFYSNAKPRMSRDLCEDVGFLVPTLCVGMPTRAALRPNLGGGHDAERRRRHSHAERGNEILRCVQLPCDVPSMRSATASISREKTAVSAKGPVFPGLRARRKAQHQNLRVGLVYSGRYPLLNHAENPLGFTHATNGMRAFSHRR